MSRRRKSAAPNPDDQLWSLSWLGWLVVLFFIVLPLLVGLVIGAAWF